MKKHYLLLPVLLIIFTTLLIPNKTYAEELTIKYEVDSQSLCDLKATERKLWSEHVQWTRNFIISDLDSLRDKEAVLQRLLKNQDDLGESIRPYYGDVAANELSKLLREHIVIAGQLIDASKNNNKGDVQKYNKLWYDNADKIALLLSNANANWSNEELQDMLYKHLQYTTDEVVQRLNKDWNKDIAAYDQGYSHILDFADILSNGIAKQFPEKFK